MRLQINHLVPLAALVLLNGCVSAGDAPALAPAPLANGPSADYPVVIGEAFTIEGVTYTPSDQLNYDAVGHAAVAADVGQGIAAAHKTLPLPSYVEVTSLNTGKTILVRVEERGPMVNDRLIALSQAASVQLGLAGGNGAPVRVRRVNPPEQERAMLRAGEAAPERMETPQALLKVLNRKLAENTPLAAAKPAPASAVAPQPVPARSVEKERVSTPEISSAEPTGKEAPAAADKHGLVVQVAAFSTEARAEAAAGALGANVSKPGKYWYVRLGPYASQADASAGLAKAGYGDARIQRAN
jgi:rare lipoprotein A